MSILNVNQIQPVGSGQTVTISAANITASGGNFVGNVTGNATGLSGSPTLTGITSVSTTNLTVNGNAYPNAGPLSNRNLVINGAMAISQRGSSHTGISVGNYFIDQFNFSGSSFGTWTIEQSTDAPDGFATSYKATCTTANASPASGNSLSLQHRIEAQNLQHLGFGSSSAKSLTLSFWVKSNKTGTNQISLFQYDSSRIIASSYTINAADTWEYKTFTFAGDTSGQIDNNNETGIAIWWPLFSGSTYTGGSIPTSWETYTTTDFNVPNINYADATSNYFAVTGVQLEVGTVATPFEHRSYGDELARCQRYYFRDTHTVTAGPEHFFFVGYMLSTTQFEGVYPFPVEMRAAPSLGSSAMATFALRNGGGAPNSINIFAANTRSTQIYTSNSAVGSQWQGNALRGASGAGTTTYLEFIAEL